MSSRTPSHTKSRKKSSWPRIHTRKLPGGQSVWVIDARVAGERIFRRYSTAQEAEDFAAELRSQRQREGEAAFSIPASLRVEAVKCSDMLSPFPGATITHAVTHFVNKVLRFREAPNVETAIAQLLEEKAKGNRRARTLENLRSRWGAFSRDFGKRQFGEITERELSKWLDSVSTSPTNRHNYRRAVMQLYRAAIRKHWCDSNVMAEATDRVQLDEKPAGILTVEQCARLLEHSDKHSMTAYAVIGLFCGLRREELERLQWDAIKLSERIITVGADVAKLRRQRHVTITDTAALWLAGIVKKSGPVVDPENFRKRFDQWRKASGLRRWPNNALRHTFGSIHLATFKDEVRTAHEMGNSPDMVHRHYKALVTETGAAKYWSLRPGADVAEKIVALKVG
jgi:integrase